MPLKNYLSITRDTNTGKNNQLVTLFPL